MTERGQGPRHFPSTSPKTEQSGPSARGSTRHSLTHPLTHSAVTPWARFPPRDWDFAPGPQVSGVAETDNDRPATSRGGGGAGLEAKRAVPRASAPRGTPGAPVGAASPWEGGARAREIVPQPRGSPAHRAPQELPCPQTRMSPAAEERRLLVLTCAPTRCQGVRSCQGQQGVRPSCGLLGISATTSRSLTSGHRKWGPDRGVQTAVNGVF